MRDGFKLIGGLADGFWDAIFPTPDEDGTATRVAAITGLNGEGADGTLILPMRNVSVTQGSEHVFSYWQFEQALQVEKIADPEKKAARLADGAVAMETFVASVRETPASFFTELLADIEGASQAFSEMNAVLERRAGADAPPSGKIRESLEQIASSIRFFAADKLAAAQAAAPVAEGESGVESVAAGGTNGGGARRPGSYETREQALAELTKIAEFFRRIEPHSPISYTLEEAVRRGRMPLPELLSELIEDAAARRLFLVSSGIKPPEAEAS
jgi:type VI secretion system protein ImpA